MCTSSEEVRYTMQLFQVQCLAALEVGGRMSGFFQDGLVYVQSGCSVRPGVAGSGLAAFGDGHTVARPLSLCQGSSCSGKRWEGGARACVP